MRLSDDVIRSFPGDELELEWRGPDPHIDVVGEDPLEVITALWLDGNTVATFEGAELVSA